ncbi:hypothetical protein BT69DRAFT_1288768, partial [Atractiella rhizophila]
MGQGHGTRPNLRTFPTPINGQFRLRGSDDNAIMGSLPLAQILQLSLTYAVGTPIATAVRALILEDTNKNANDPLPPTHTPKPPSDLPTDPDTCDQC